MCRLPLEDGAGGAGGAADGISTMMRAPAQANERGGDNLAKIIRTGHMGSALAWADGFQLGCVWGARHVVFMPNGSLWAHAIVRGWAKGCETTAIVRLFENLVMIAAGAPAALPPTPHHISLILLLFCTPHGWVSQHCYCQCGWAF